MLQSSWYLKGHVCIKHRHVSIRKLVFLTCELRVTRVKSDPILNTTRSRLLRATGSMKR